MSWFGHDSHEANAHKTVLAQMHESDHHQAHLSHELIAGAASFEAAKAYEKHCATNGKPVNHAMAKELLAGFAGAFVDRMVETKGLDAIEAAKAKHTAHKVNEERFTKDVYEEFEPQGSYSQAASSDTGYGGDLSDDTPR
ncbi:CipC protein [Mycena leptocephala]|nr:CipC protein [Mycena leptocephala]